MNDNRPLSTVHYFRVMYFVDLLMLLAYFFMMNIANTSILILNIKSTQNGNFLSFQNHNNVIELSHF